MSTLPSWHKRTPTWKGAWQKLLGTWLLVLHDAVSLMPYDSRIAIGRHMPSTHLPRLPSKHTLTPYVCMARSILPIPSKGGAAAPLSAVDDSRWESGVALILPGYAPTR